MGALTHLVLKARQREARKSLCSHKQGVKDVHPHLLSTVSPGICCQSQSCPHSAPSWSCWAQVCSPLSDKSPTSQLAGMLEGSSKTEQQQRNREKTLSGQPVTKNIVRFFCQSKTNYFQNPFSRSTQDCPTQKIILVLFLVLVPDFAV